MKTAELPQKNKFKFMRGSSQSTSILSKKLSNGKQTGIVCYSPTDDASSFRGIFKFYSYSTSLLISFCVPLSIENKTKLCDRIWRIASLTHTKNGTWFFLYFAELAFYSFVGAIEEGRSGGKDYERVSNLVR